ncbi:MAG: NADH-quinone oxidoreductase subunit L [Pseudomonadota bacterium]
MSYPVTDIASSLPAWQGILLLGPIFACALAALIARPGTASTVAWRAARWAAIAAMGFSFFSLAAVLIGGPRSGSNLRADIPGGVLLLLVSFVGWVIVRYSQPYLHGGGRECHYVRWLMATLATVAVVVTSNHMLVLALAWGASSLALHRLLTFFGDRPPAVVAAHKKFIVGRVADACMLMAAGLLFHAFGTMQIDQLGRLAKMAPALGGAAQAAVVLIAVAALLKCAQLPFHGWLIQVMEAPTPVSALLHAGIVNLGGFVLMRYAALVAEVPAAQILLVVAGTATAVLAALVMTTRISVKVMLAWSTCAQMGFMLMQCGLGVWEMALLHLVAHSLYKAHAFLGAGGAVRRALIVRLTPPVPTPALFDLLAGALIGIVMTFVAGAMFNRFLPGQNLTPALWVLAGIVALALVPLVHSQSLRLGGMWRAALGLGAFGTALAYFGLHEVFALLVQRGDVMAHKPQVPLLIGVSCAFSILFVVQSVVTVSPRGRIARYLYPWFYGGLFLDEKFNSITFAVWRPPAPVASGALLPLPDTSIAAIQPAVSSGAHS